jgi:arabinofuranosyltransferase
MTAVSRSPAAETDEPAAPQPARSRRARLVQGSVLAVPCAVLLARAWDHRWMTDDAFINLRVVRMIQGGHGPVFNVGERVEVTTSPLWVWILTLGDLVLPIALEWVAVVLGLVGAVGGLALATAGAARLHRRAFPGAGFLVPAGAAVVAALAPMWDFSTSGLEGGLTFGWLGLTGYVLARWAGHEPDQGRRLGAGGAVVLGLGTLVRPDLALVTVVALAGVLLAQWAEDRWLDRLRLVAATLAVPVAYQIFRVGYFASLVPNTALAKNGGRSRWGVGWAYLRDLVQPYWLVVPLVALLALVLAPAVLRAWRSGRRRVAVGLAALPVGGLLDGVYVVRVGGDYMHGRLLLPALFALLVPVAAAPLPALRTVRALPRPRIEGRGLASRLRSAEALAGGAAVATLVWAVVCAASLRPGTPVPTLFSSDGRAGNVRAFGEHAVTAADQGWGPDDPGSQFPPDVLVLVGGRPVAVDPPADLRTPASAGFGIGVTGYAYGPDVNVIDMLGLADPVTSRFQLDRPGPTGHEKPIPPAWLAARISTGPVDPDLLPDPFVGRPLWESPDGRLDADAEAARAAMRCGDLRDLGEAVRAPMTPGRFVSNLFSAPRFTRVTVPPDPEAARSRFCD